MLNLVFGSLEATLIVRILVLTLVIWNIIHIYRLSDMFLVDKTVDLKQRKYLLQQDKFAGCVLFVLAVISTFLVLVVVVVILTALVIINMIVVIPANMLVYDFKSAQEFTDGVIVFIKTSFCFMKKNKLTK